MVASPKTQKAIGVIQGIPQLLKSVKHLTSYLHFNEHALIQTNEDIDQRWNHNGEMKYVPVPYHLNHFPLFARPCPLVPRHGFVESKTVKDVNEMKKLLKKVMKEDPQGEIIVGGNYRGVKHSAVYVSSGMLSVGPGNDGATGGKKSVSFPVAPHKADETFLNTVKINKSESMYLESIRPAYGTWLLVQVRGGPTIEQASEDFIPKVVKVGKVIVPNDNLLEWERQVKTLKNNTVVYGNGHTLASHAAVHCVLHNIPFVTSRKPKVGETLRPTESRKQKQTMKRENFRRGIFYGVNNKITRSMSEEFRFSLSVLHNWSRLKQSQHADWLVGVAISVFARTCMAIAFGEYRHYDRSLIGGGRDTVYDTVTGHCVKYIHKLPTVFKAFHSGYWNSGYGGIPWANCTWYTIALWKEIIKAYNCKSAALSDRNVAKLLDAMNRTVNLVHNGGWWFNKIASEYDMDFVAANPGLAAFSVADVFYKAAVDIKKIKDISSLTFEKNVKVYSPCALDKDKQLVWAFLRNVNGYDSYSFHESGRQKFSFAVETRKQDGKHKTEMYANLTRRQAMRVEDRIGASGKLYLKAVANKGFRLPNGGMLAYKGIRPV